MAVSTNASQFYSQWNAIISQNSSAVATKSHGAINLCSQETSPVFSGVRPLNCGSQTNLHFLVVFIRSIKEPNDIRQFDTDVELSIYFVT